MPRGHNQSQHGGEAMNDAWSVAISVAFFATCAAYAYFCEKVR
jgi:hypothetical protein